jgi:hypothetical protein
MWHDVLMSWPLAVVLVCLLLAVVVVYIYTDVTRREDKRISDSRVVSRHSDNEG